jgi:hypothetical protein
MMSTSSERALSWTQIGTGVGIFIFWLLFFTVGMAPANPSACYFPFTHSFLFPDSLLAIALIASGIGVLKGAIWGRGLSLACAGALLLLGVVDLSFSAQSGGFEAPFIDTLVSIDLPLWCIAVGVWIFAVHATHV